MEMLIYKALPIIGGVYAERRAALLACRSPLISAEGGQRRPENRRLTESVRGGVL
jgi:hypothetical protein